MQASNTYRLDVSDLLGSHGPRKQLNEFRRATTHGYPSWMRKLVRTIYRALAAVPDTLERRLLRLHYQQGLTIEQCAQILGISKPACNLLFASATNTYEQLFVLQANRSSLFCDVVEQTRREAVRKAQDGPEAVADNG